MLPHGQAHELQTNRVTLILRDGQHLSLTFFINYTEALHRALAPERPLPEFLLPISTLPLPELETLLQRAHNKFQSDTRLLQANGKTVPIRQWVWPEPARVQQILQQRAMQTLVAAADHPHEPPLEIRAEAGGQAANDMNAIRLSFPAEFGQVLVVSYQPRQVGVPARSLSPVIRF